VPRIIIVGEKDATGLGELYRAMEIKREDRPVECCRIKENCEPYQLKPDLTVERCKVCGRRHFEMTLEPGKFGITGGTL
jgi:hypothetical protein